MGEVNLSVSPQEHSSQAAQEPRAGTRPGARGKRPLRIALFGFGTVGSSVARILVESRPEGLELTHIYNRGLARKRVDWVPASVVWSEDADAVLGADVDVIVELAGGLDPAGGWVREALEAGKSVVTANKKLIAFQGVELERLAAARGGHLKYGAAVAGGIPVIPGLEQGLAGDRIERIEGILNGTCNFILSKMEEGAEYAPVLAEAQAKGYAEADPTEDVGGFDARAKLAILMRLALRVEVDPEEIVPRPITRFRPWTSAMRAIWAAPSARWRGPSRLQGQVAATVGPMLVDSALAAGVVAGHGEHGDPDRPLRRGCGLFRPRSGRPSDGGGGGERPAGAGARVAAGRASVGSGAGGRRVRGAALHPLPGRRPAGNRGRDYRRAGQGADQHSRHRAEAGLSAARAALRDHRGAMQIVRRCNGRSASIRTMDCMLEEPLDLQMLE